MKVEAAYTHIIVPAEMICIEIVLCYAVKALRELDEGKLVTCFGVNEKAHGLTKRFRIIGVHVAIKSQNEWSIAHYARDSYLPTFIQTNWNNRSPF